MGLNQISVKIFLWECHQKRRPALPWQQQHGWPSLDPPQDARSTTSPPLQLEIESQLTFWRAGSIPASFTFFSSCHSWFLKTGFCSPLPPPPRLPPCLKTCSKASPRSPAFYYSLKQDHILKWTLVGTLASVPSLLATFHSYVKSLHEAESKKSGGSNEGLFVDASFAASQLKPDNYRRTAEICNAVLLILQTSSFL